MTRQPELDELRQLRQRALEMGGAEQIERQHASGRLTARERIALLADAGTFRETAALVGKSVYDGDRLVSFAPKSEIYGSCSIEGRKILLTAGDSTSRRGPGGPARGALGAETGPAERALELRVPYVRLLDGAGGSVSSTVDLGRTFLPDGNSIADTEVQLLQVVPVASAVLGSVAGWPAVSACLSHFTVMVRNTAHLFPGGPPVVKAALGLDISKEELGGADLHTRISGVINNVADTEAEALEQIRRFLSYLPPSVDELPPRNHAADREPVLSAQQLRDFVPSNPRQPYDARALLRGLVDPESLFELAPGFGTSRVTGLARIDGFPVGVMANNPRFLGGATDVAAGEKVMKLIQLCDQFHLPLISFADEPGFMVGPQVERQGIELAGARLVWATCRSSMPWATIVIRRLFGVGGQTHHRPSGMFRRYAWPSARWGAMHIEGGTEAAYRRIVEAADDPAAKLKEIEEELRVLSSPFRTAAVTGQDIIDPAETRELLVEFVTDAQRVLERQRGMSATPYRP